MKRTYYWILAERIAGIWSCQFGDYSRSTVQEEYRDFRRNTKALNLRICPVMSDSQKDIDACIDQLNLNDRS